jgi:hypothetical protein
LPSGRNFGFIIQKGRKSNKVKDKILANFFVKKNSKQLPDTFGTANVTGNFQDLLMQQGIGTVNLKVSCYNAIML